ncbi:hypothetical protein AURANDRAFT_35571, partial [Aureococcus anophagefferens]
CGSCGIPVRRKKRLTLDAVPNVLIIHLKRFNALDSRKVKGKIDFPTDRPLDLGPFLSRCHGPDCRPLSDPGPHLYELNAVVNHHGDINRGHYTSFVQEGGHWFLCDDHHIALVDVDTVKDSEGYILFYVRKVLTKLTSK